MNTKIEYLYRDASNYKVWNECVIRGEISEEQIETIIGCLNCGEYFIPEQVGLPATRFGSATEDDHCWMELDADGFSSTDKNPTENLDVEQLVQKFQEVDGCWDDIAYAVY